MPFLQRLNDFKEFIAILVFFLGGVVWIYDYFATKQQLVQFNCLLTASISIARADADTKYLSDKIVEIDLQATELDEKRLKGPLSAAEKKRLIELTNDSKNKQNEFAAAKQRFEESNQKIQSNLCVN